MQKFIVDVDDKSCLAELTVVLKLNQGVRQWPYIIAGAFFFRPFFWASKRKGIKLFQAKQDAEEIFICPSLWEGAEAISV